ncbi:hypothetical protein QQ045_000983 [Rhodiola kirilowii]
MAFWLAVWLSTGGTVGRSCRWLKVGSFGPVGGSFCVQKPRLVFSFMTCVVDVGLAWAVGFSPIAWLTGVWIDGMVSSVCLIEETGSDREFISGAWLHQFGPFGGLRTLDLFTVKDDSTGVDNFAGHGLRYYVFLCPL